jgi:D-3-phosphoglycerate dehydrogenase / 2-oxoglutarate reductase
MKVVATGPWDRPGWEQPLLDAGCEVVCGVSVDTSWQHRYTEDELVELLNDADAAIVATRERVTRHVLERLPNLKVIARATIGVENIDHAAATDLGMLVVNSPAPENFIGIAEATVGLILALAKRLRENEARLRSGFWKAPASLGSLIRGQTVGLVGLGRVGSNVARRLAGWDVRLLACDPYVEPAHAMAVGAELVPLDTLITTADYVSLHVVLTDETRCLIGAPRLRAMKPTAYLVNTSRGPVVDENALATAIQERWIAGAALDVFEDEPLGPESRLRDLDPERLILTPHCIGNNLASQATGIRMVCQAVLQALGGEVPRHVTNPSVIPLWQARHARS